MSLWCVLLFVSLSCHAQDTSPPKPFQAYRQAVALLGEYNSLTSNLTHIHFLLQSAQIVPEALYQLGEFYLFGYPVSPDSQLYKYTLPEFLTPDLHFRRDIPKAVDYLQRAAQLGSRQAGAVLAFLMQQGILVPELRLINTTDVKTDILAYQLAGEQKGSDYARAWAVAGHIQCKRLSHTYMPEVLDLQSPSFYSVPYFDEFSDCMGSCDTVVKHAQKLASDAIELYQSKGGRMNYDIGPLREVLEEVEKQEASNRLSMLRKMAAGGDQQAVASLADSFLFGNTEVGIDRDPAAAVEFYTQAAENGNVGAMQNLGTLYLNGIGSEKNYTKALHYLSKAADLGSPAAYNGLGYMTEHGLGVKANKTLALQYFKQAAAAGHVESQSNLGNFYLNGQGVPQDFSMALHYFEPAAAAGHRPAIVSLAVMYLNGYGVKKSCKKALQLFNEVISEGLLGQRLQRAYYFYRYEDYEGAYLSYALAASLGFTSAMLSAAYMWETERVPFTCQFGTAYCAAQYYGQAVLQAKDSWAYFRLGHISFYGNEYFQANFRDAFAMYLQSDVPEARYALAHMHEYGLGTAADVEAAQQIYEDLLNDWDARYPALLTLSWLRLRLWVKPLWHWLTKDLSWLQE
jgi:TPR repeat protein